MKDEIKEILDKFDKVLENYELDKKWGQMSVDSICHLFPSEMMVIKDYITNLQEENERLKEINKINNDEDYIYTYEELQDKVLKLQKEYNDLSKKLWCEVDDRIKYKLRNEKALNKIQYIIDYGFDYDGFNTVESLKGLIDMLVDYARQSKDILNGGDEE